jgi:antirestriction protein ArdC
LPRQVPVLDPLPATVITPIEQAEAFVAATGASIHHGGGRAYYRPSTDSIQIPPREAFIGTLPRRVVLHIIVCWRLLSVLKADKKAIFTAASKASEAAAFLAALQGA